MIDGENKGKETKAAFVSDFDGRGRLAGFDAARFAIPTPNVEPQCPASARKGGADSGKARGKSGYRDANCAVHRGRAVWRVAGGADPAASRAGLPVGCIAGRDRVIHLASAGSAGSAAAAESPPCAASTFPTISHAAALCGKSPAPAPAPPRRSPSPLSDAPRRSLGSAARPAPRDTRAKWNQRECGGRSSFSARKQRRYPRGARMDWRIVDVMRDVSRGSEK